MMEKKITELLSMALDDMESLQTYYDSQKEHVKTYVNDNIEKYRFGLILDKFLSNQISESSETINISQKEQDIIDELIDDFSIEEDDGKKFVKYVLSDKALNSGYILEPSVARKGAIKLIKQPKILNDSMIMMLLVKYEEAIADIYRFLLHVFPQAYLLEKNIPYSDLISAESNIDEIKEKLINKEVEEFLRMALSDWYKCFESKHKIEFYYNAEEFNSFKEVYYRRNLIVHNQGIVNETYISNVPKSEVRIGDKINVDSEYLNHAFFVTKKILIGTFWGLRKIADDVESLREFLFNYGYDCLKKEEWGLAEFINCMLLSDNSQSGADRTCEQVNMWIAIKNDRGLKCIENDIRKLDVSAMKTQFVVAKYALLDEYDEVSRYLECAIDGEIPSAFVEEWPLFIQYRNTKQYKDFVDKHKGLFVTKEYEPEDQVGDNSEEMVFEFGDMKRNEDVEEEVDLPSAPIVTASSVECE